MRRWPLGLLVRWRLARSLNANDKDKGLTKGALDLDQRARYGYNRVARPPTPLINFFLPVWPLLGHGSTATHTRPSLDFEGEHRPLLSPLGRQRHASLT